MIGRPKSFPGLPYWRVRRGGWAAILGVAASSLALASAAATRPATVAADTAAPALRLLKQECFGCHNPEKLKGGLSLTSREAMLKGGDDGTALVPGKARQSPLITSLAADADTHMPPKKQLSAADVAAVAAWVDAGAKWDNAALRDAGGGGAGTFAGGAATRPVAFGELPATYAPVLAVALSGDGATLAVGRGRRVYLYDPAKPDRPPVRALEGPRDVVQSLAWSPDGKRLAVGEYGRALVFETADLTRPPVVLAGLTGRVTALLFLADNETLIAADGGAGVPARLLTYRLPDDQPTAVAAAAHADAILAIARTADGKTLATAGGDKVVRLWDPADLARPLGLLEGHTGRVSAVAFSPDGTLLASGSADRDLKVWDVKTRERKQSVGPHPSAVTAVVWAEPKKVAVACEDGTVRLDPTDSDDLGRPFPATAEDVLYCLAPSADGKTLYAGCHDGQVYVFGPGGKLLAKLR